MGFLKKLVKKSVGIDKKIALRPIKDAKKAINVGNKLSSKVGGPTLRGRGAMGMTLADKRMDSLMNRGGKRQGMAPPVSTGAPAPKRFNPGIAPTGIRPAGKRRPY